MLKHKIMIGVFEYLGSCAATMAIVWQIFDRTDKGLGDSVKQRLSKWLRRIELPDRDQYVDWRSAFLNSIDILFGKRPFSFRFIFRSVIASVASLVVAGFLASSILAGLGQINYFSDIITNSNNITTLVTMFLFVNFIIDYVSLLQTRKIFDLLGNFTGIYSTAACFIIDLFATLLIFLLPTLLLWRINLTAIILIDAKALTSIDVTIFVAVICLCSTFFTTICVWIFAVSAGIIRTIGLLGPYWIYLRDNILGVDERPVHALGLVANMLVVVVYLIVGIVLVVTA